MPWQSQTEAMLQEYQHISLVHDTANSTEMYSDTLNYIQKITVHLRKNETRNLKLNYLKLLFAARSMMNFNFSRAFNFE